MVACMVTTTNVLIILLLRLLLGFFAITDVLVREYIDNSSTKYNIVLNMISIFLSPRALSMGLGCILTSSVIFHCYIIIPNDNILGLPVIIVSVMIIAITLLTSILISDEEINTHKSVLTYVESEGSAFI